MKSAEEHGVANRGFTGRLGFQDMTTTGDPQRRGSLSACSMSGIARRSPLRETVASRNKLQSMVLC